MERQVKSIFLGLVFQPVVALLEEVTPQASGILENSGESNLREALRRGQVQYKDGVFSGVFGARIGGILRGMGAEFDSVRGIFTLPAWTVPGWVKAEASSAEFRAKSVHEAILRKLDAAQERLSESVAMRLVNPAKALAAIQHGFIPAAKALGVVTDIGPAALKRMERDYQEDIRPYVSDATAKFIDVLHKHVTDNAAAGYRYDHLVVGIQKEYGVSVRKARFLARQETALFMSSYRAERFKAAGVRTYRWSTSHDIRVRPYANDPAEKKYGDHRALDGREFNYTDKAPAEYMSSGRPCNPGEDFGCRCVDIALLEPSKVRA